MSFNPSTPLNNVRASLASAHAPGDGQLSLGSGQGARFGTITPPTWLRVTVITAASYGRYPETLMICEVTGRTGDILTGVAAIEGTTDRPFTMGDFVEARATAGMFSEVQSLGGGVTPKFNPVLKSASGTVDADETFCLCDARDGVFTLTLPPANSAVGLEFVFIKDDSTNMDVTLAANGDDLFWDGPPTYTLTSMGQILRIISTGATWWVIGKGNM